jgi:hypothetical protein
MAKRYLNIIAATLSHLFQYIFMKFLIYWIGYIETTDYQHPIK